jgi:hypothetical protein
MFTADSHKLQSKLLPKRPLAFHAVSHDNAGLRPFLQFRFEIECWKPAYRLRNQFDGRATVFSSALQKAGP